MKPEIEIDGALTKVKKVRKDRGHFQKSVFDDDAPVRKAAGKRGHSRYIPVIEEAIEETLFDVDEYDTDYLPTIEEIKRVLR
jgi:hypothetical protein